MGDIRGVKEGGMPGIVMKGLRRGVAVFTYWPRMQKAPQWNCLRSMDSSHSSTKRSSNKSAVSEYQKASERLAAERTFLAWIRTSISVISLGFVVAKFGVWLRELADRLEPGSLPHKSAASLPIGVGLMAVGGVLALLALWHYHAVNRAIDEDNVQANRGLVTTVAVVVAALAALVIVYLLLTTRNQ